MADQNLPDSKDKLAIQLAFEANWEEAIKVNQEILESSPNNTAALNRLGVAYLKTNNLTAAKKAFQAVIDIDPYNNIAKTNLKRTTSKYLLDGSSQILVNNSFSFIEEPGKSKVIRLTSLGEPNIIAQLYTGATANLKVSARRVQVVLPDSKAHIGYLPDDISLHLVKLIKIDYTYQVVIKSAEFGHVEVFVKETSRGKEQNGAPSFQNFHAIDQLNIGPDNIPSQPPLEIYDSALGDSD